jgi:hypothetical protein
MKTKEIKVSPIKILFLVAVAIFSLAVYSCGTDCGEEFPAPATDSTAAARG